MVTLEQVEQRVAILKKLKTNLIAQRGKFHNYLKLLEEEEKDIISGDLEKLGMHIEMEQSVVKEITAFQKVINPLKEMYKTVYPNREKEIPEINNSLERIKSQVLKRNNSNRDLLRKEMAVVKKEIDIFRINYKNNSPFQGSEIPLLIDIIS